MRQGAACDRLQRPAVLRARGTAAHAFLAAAVRAGDAPCLRTLAELDVSGARQSRTTPQRRPLLDAVLECTLQDSLASRAFPCNARCPLRTLASRPADHVPCHAPCRRLKLPRRSSSGAREGCLGRMVGLHHSLGQPPPPAAHAAPPLFRRPSRVAPADPFPVPSPACSTPAQPCLLPFGQDSTSASVVRAEPLDAAGAAAWTPGLLVLLLRRAPRLRRLAAAGCRSLAQGALHSVFLRHAPRAS